MKNILPKKFYETTDVVQIAKNLLGKQLISHCGGETTTGIIVETEAYKAPEDLASHARGNKRTPRNQTMYSPAGNSYVYICYGIHNLFNVVTGPENIAHAVLIRAVQPLSGQDVMVERRNMSRPKYEMMNGPGKFTVAMGITKDHDEVLLYDNSSPIQIAENDFKVQEIISGPRVGMSSLTKECGHWPWRFRVKNNKWTSKPNVVNYDW